MNSQKMVNWIGQSLFITLILHYFIKLSYIVGSYCMFFSGSSVILPVAGLYASWPCLALVFLFRSAHSLLNPIYFITHYFPGMGAALSMRFNHWMISVATPAVCMMLFMMHPVAGQVWIYSCYWLIPMIIYFLEQRTGPMYFLTALRSTFIAHALGSVIWAYLKPITVAQWQLLLPIVVLERLVFAGSITICCMTIDWIKTRRVKAEHTTNACVVES